MNDLKNISSETEIAIFAGGCFWCMEAVFELVPGVVSIEPGYTGGDVVNPSYEEVCNGETNHAEAIRIFFKPNEITYIRLLEIFFSAHDPTTLNSQGGDFGTQYRSAIFFTDKNQEKMIAKYINTVEGDYSDKIVTEISKFKEFYPAAEYHHAYFRKNPQNSYCKVVIKSKVDKLKKKLTNK